MGEVLLDQAPDRPRRRDQDRHAGDDVGDSLRRFVREARIQGQLDHPAMVPVYDLGARSDGDVFFTMKRVRGVTLDAALVGVGRGDSDAAHRYGGRRLLTAYIVVCQAIELAHARGVVHRDLKPANIMLGDYGEVYVLDWGVAKLATDPDPHSSVIRPSADDADTDLTLTGTFLGTPGYCARAGRRPPGRSPRRVYALGALLSRSDLAAAAPARLDGRGDRVDDGPGPDARASALPRPRGAARARGGPASPPQPPASRSHRVGRRDARRVEAFMDGDRDLERGAARDQLAGAASDAAAAALAGDHGRAARRCSCRARLAIAPIRRSRSTRSCG